MSWFTVFLSFLLCASAANAQVDIESRRLDEGASHTGEIEIDFTLRGGNVDLVEFGPTVSVNFTRGRNTFLVIGSGNLGWENGERFANEFLGHLRWVLLWKSRIQPEAFVQANYDKSRKLDIRTLAGGGLRVRLGRNDRGALWAGSAYMIEHEENEDALTNAHPASTSVSRWANYFSASAVLSSTAEWSAIVYVQPDMVDFSDVRVLVETGLEVKVTETVSLDTYLSIHHDADPVDGIAETDYALKTALKLKW